MICSYLFIILPILFWKQMTVLVQNTTKNQHNIFLNKQSYDLIHPAARSMASSSQRSILVLGTNKMGGGCGPSWTLFYQDWSVGWYEKPWDPRSSCWDIQYVRLVQEGIPTSQNSWKQGKFNPPSLELAGDKVYDPATGKLVRLDAWELRDGGTQRCRTGCPFSLSEWCKDGSSATLSHWTNESLKKKVWNMSYVCEFVVVSMFHVILIPIQNDRKFSAGPWTLLGSTIWGWNARLFGWVKRDLQFVPWTRDNRGTYWWFNACDFGVHARQRTECLDVGMKCGTLKTPSIIGRESQKRCVWQQIIVPLKSCMKNGNDAFLQGTASQILMMRTCFTIMMTETSEICRFRGRIARSLFVPNLFDIYLASLWPFPFAGYMFAVMKDYRGRSQQQVFISRDFFDLKKGHKKPNALDVVLLHLTNEYKWNDMQ